MSKIYIKIDENEMVNYQHNLPFDSKYGLNKSESELLTEGYLVDYVPEIPHQEGKVGSLKYVNGNFEVVYEDAPMDTQTEVKQLKATNEALMSAISDLTVYIANQDAQIQTQNEAISELTILFAGGNA